LSDNSCLPGGTAQTDVVLISAPEPMLVRDVNAYVSRLNEAAKRGGQAAVWLPPTQQRVVPASVQNMSLSAIRPTPTSFREVMEFDKLRQAVLGIPLFKSLPPSRLPSLIDSAETRQYAAGTAIMEQGGSADGFFWICSGRVSIQVDGQHRRDLAPRQYFGERSLLGSVKVASASCIAAVDTECVRIHPKAFVESSAKLRAELEARIAVQDMNVRVEELTREKIIGQGTFGQVWLVRHKSNPSILYALKKVSRASVIRQNQQKSIQTEREVMALCFHPTLVTLYATGKDAHAVYFLTEFLDGGDLFFAVRAIGKLTTAQVHFFSASIILAIQYLHQHGFMYRDLKPENAMLDGDGWVKLLDMGCCTKAARAYSLVGTPAYVAPEIIQGRGYGAAVDWWSLGVVMYEFVCGPQPFGFDCESHAEMFEAILQMPLEFPSFVKDGPEKACIEGLLNKKPLRRLGSGATGAEAIISHAYFEPFCRDGLWEKLLERTMEPPWKPNVKEVQKDWKDPPAEEDEKSEDSSSSSSTTSDSDAAKAAKQRDKDLYLRRHRGWDQDF